MLPKETDITQAFNHFAQRKCINHQRRKASSVCLHEDCWKSVIDEAFLCEDCNVNHVMKHTNSMRFNALFTDELFEECDEYNKNPNTKNKLKERISKFDEKINELNKEIEQWTKYQFSKVKKFIEDHLLEKINIEHFDAIKNLKKMLSETRKDLSINYKTKEIVNSYCIQMQNIQNHLNEQIISEEEKKDDKTDNELDSKLQQMGNEIKENITNQVDQLTMNLIDTNKKIESLKNESLILIEEDLNSENILGLEIPIVKILSNKSLDEDKIVNNNIIQVSNDPNKSLNEDKIINNIIKVSNPHNKKL